MPAEPQNPSDLERYAPLIRHVMQDEILERLDRIIELLGARMLTEDDVRRIVRDELTAQHTITRVMRAIEEQIQVHRP